MRVPEARRISIVDLFRSSLGLSNDRRYDPGLDEKIGQALSSLTLFTRSTTLKAVAGPLRPVIDQAFKASEKMPYQTGYDRLPFRSRLLKSARHRNLARVANACN